MDTLSKHLFAPLFELVTQTHGTSFQTVDKVGLLTYEKGYMSCLLGPSAPLPRPPSPLLLRRHVSVGVIVRRAGRVWRFNIGSSTTQHTSPFQRRSRPDFLQPLNSRLPTCTGGVSGGRRGQRTKNTPHAWRRSRRVEDLERARGERRTHASAREK